MITRASSIILLLCVFAVVGCTVAVATPDNGPIDTNLIGAKWQLTSGIVDDRSFAPGDTRYTPYLQFTDEQALDFEQQPWEGWRVVGFGGCNRLDGRYKLGEGQIIYFIGVYNTAMACQERATNDLETKLLDFLQVTVRYEIAGDTLTLFDPEENSLKFTRVTATLAPTVGAIGNESIVVTYVVPTATPTSTATPTPTATPFPVESLLPKETAVPFATDPVLAQWTRYAWEPQWNMALPPDWHIVDDGGSNHGFVIIQGEWNGRSYELTLAFPIIDISLNNYDLESLVINVLRWKVKENPDVTSAEVIFTEVAEVKTAVIYDIREANGQFAQFAYLWRKPGVGPRSIILRQTDGATPDLDGMRTFFNLFLAGLQDTSTPAATYQNPDFACPSVFIKEAEEGQPYPVQWLLNDGEQAEMIATPIDQLVIFCMQMSHTFQESGMTPEAATLVLAQVAGDDTWFTDADPHDNSAPRLPFTLTERLMIAQINDTQYELFFYRFDNGRQYVHLQAEKNDGGVITLTPLAIWTELIVDGGN